MQFRTILATAAVPAALAATLLTAGVASASTGPASNGQVGHLTGNQAISYADPYFGPVQCNEVQHAAFDNVTCHFTAGQDTGGWLPGNTGQVGWNSDFGPGSIVPNGKPVIRTGQGTLTFTITGNALTGQVDGYTGQVIYP